MTAAAAGPTIHATAVMVGGLGVLIRGPSGSGKSALALALIEDPRGDARLVADDRVILTTEDGCLAAAAPLPLAGLIEARGIGILRRPHAGATMIRLIVDLLPPAECRRFPDPAERQVSVAGVTLPRLAVPIGAADAALRVRIGLREWVKPAGAVPSPAVRQT
jgi:serine kinase of HPr protein (carbohydrate metabolism regulator)